jgi:hypothetical protein
MPLAVSGRTTLCYQRHMRPLPPLLMLLGACQEFDISTVDVAELFQQSPFEKVDILIVVDNSGSMGPYQTKLGEDFGLFFDYFAEAEVDWQLAVTHTDARAEDFGRLRGPIVTAAASDPEALFAEVVNVGTEGGGIEAGLAAVTKVLEFQRDGFPRDDSGVSVIIVSDEEDASPGAVYDYVNGWFDLRGHRQREAFNLSALTVTELADCTPEQFAASSAGTRYVEAARVTGGITANLCVDAFDEIVRDLALTTSTLLEVFYLRDTPDLTTLEVRIEGELIPCDSGRWWYELVDREGKEVPAIRFDPFQLPAPGAEVLVEYDRGVSDPADFCPQEAL